MLDDLRLHQLLIGQPDSSRRLNTPVLLIERAALERNLQRMADFARSHGVGLRPHAKTHKSAHIARRQIAAGASGVCCANLQSVIELLAQHGAAPPLITGSGTGTHRIDGALGVFTEWQVGSYLFMDRQYADCELTAQGPAPFEYSLFVEASVVSTNTLGMATIDAGFKAFATDGGVPVIVSGAPAGSVYHFMGDEHGAIVDPSLQYRWNLGDRIRLAVPHCDPTVNLYDAFRVVHEGVLEDIWPVTARGRGR